jgi:hypothetical protein
MKMIDEFLLEGGILFFTLLGAVGFGLQAFFSFIFWRKGEDEYFLRFISYVLATAALIFGVISAGALWGSSEGAIIACFILFFILATAAAGVRIFIFVWNTWIKSEAKT